MFPETTPEGREAVSGRLVSEPCDLLAVNDETLLLKLRASKALIMTQIVADAADIMRERRGKA